MYPLQTKLYYKCDPGYDRKSGEYLGIQCKSKKQGAVWTYEQFECIGEWVLVFFLYIEVFLLLCYLV